MTVLETFISFAEALPADRRQAIEAALAALMESHSPVHDFTGEELSEINLRLGDTTPRFADPDEVKRLFGKPFGA